MPDHGKNIQPIAREGYLPVSQARLYFRDIGHGRPIVILHGGPDFDQHYLQPELDRLADTFRLIYYDQRGRGRSGDGVRVEDVSLESEMADLEELRKHFQLDSFVLLGHSWGGLLAMEYAIRHPQALSHLILMNTAPASHADLQKFRQSRQNTYLEELAQMQAIAATEKYQSGDLESEADYYRIHFRQTIRDTELLERVVQRLRAKVSPAGIRKARAIEHRLYEQMWFKPEYDLLPKLQQLDIRTLVLHGGYDFVPVECSRHIADIIPEARFVLLEDCGHFSYLECPEKVFQAINGFLVPPKRPI